MAYLALSHYKLKSFWDMLSGYLNQTGPTEYIKYYIVFTLWYENTKIGLKCHFIVHYGLDNIDNVNLSSQDKFLLVHDQKHLWLATMDTSCWQLAVWVEIVDRQKYREHCHFFNEMDWSKPRRWTLKTLSIFLQAYQLSRYIGLQREGTLTKYDSHMIQWFQCHSDNSRYNGLQMEVRCGTTSKPCSIPHCGHNP